MQKLRTFLTICFLTLIPLTTYAADQNHDMVGLLQKALKNDTNAQFNLGYLYQSRSQNKEDLKQAMHWYEKAADNGHANAAFALGLMYEYGQGTKVSMGKAADHYIQAAQIYQKNNLDIPVRLAKEAILRTQKNGVRFAKAKQNKIAN